jgi:hypothetical protein
VEALRYGIGQHAKQAQESDRRPFIVQPTLPIGTSAKEMRAKLLGEIEDAGRGACQARPGAGS